jgi:pimeloyl-ACP methyl ester carboxylesterase
MLPLMLHESRVKDAALIKVIREMAERTGVEGYIRQQKAIIARPDFRPLLPSIRCPTLVLCGRQDRLTPLENSEEMAQTIPGAKLMVVEECGHVSTLERPEFVNRAMRGWLGT